MLTRNPLQKVQYCNRSCNSDSHRLVQWAKDNYVIGSFPISVASLEITPGREGTLDVPFDLGDKVQGYVQICPKKKKKKKLTQSVFSPT